MPEGGENGANGASGSHGGNGASGTNGSGNHGAETPAAGAPGGTAWPAETTLRDFAGLGDGERVALAMTAGPWAVVRKIAGDEAPPAAPVIFAGSLARMPVPDVLSIANATGLEGEILFYLPDATKRVFLAGGSIVYASSNLQDDRLGEQLLAQGRISRKAFEDASDECMRERKKFGRVLIERGLLTTHDLYEALHDQVEAIVLSLFTYGDGSFAFLAGKPDVANPIRLEHPISHYVLEGVRRNDELKPALEEVSDRLSVFKPSGRAALSIADGRPGMERDIAALVDGVTPVWEILAKSAWSEANTLLALARLRRAGVIKRVRASEVVPRSSNALEPDAVVALIESVNGFLRDVQRALAAVGAKPWALSGFFDAIKPSQRALFAGVSLGEDGALASAQLAANFAQLSGAPAETSKTLREGLQDMVEYALWVASDQVVEAEAARLTAQARRIREGKQG